MMRHAILQSPRYLACAAVMMVAGCALQQTTDPALAAAIKAHYATHATEEQGACRSPKIDSIQDYRRLERSAADEDVMLVRYSYFDRHADMDADWSRLVYLSQPCGGIAERTFVIEKDERGYRVTDMSGERRDGKSEH